MRLRAPNDLLFCKLDGHSIIQNQRKQVTDEIDRLPEHQLLNASLEDLISQSVDKYQINVPLLDEDAAEVAQQEGLVDVSGFDYGFPGERRQVPGVVVTLEMPFSGDAEMFKVRPSTFNSAPPYANIQGQSIILRQSAVRPTPEQIQSGFDSAIKNINQYLDWQRRDATPFNQQLPTQARQAIEARRAKILANQNLVAGLKFKLKERFGAPKTYAVPLQRKRIVPITARSPTSGQKFVPEPILPDLDYENILKIIHDMTLVMERSPAAFSQMQEEDIRQHYLVQLNGHYEGAATGETFNAQGKTDILIRHEGKNIFIAECKFWRGEKSYLETIDQILSYLSWRDTKAAVIIFNKNRGFTNVLESIKVATIKHPLHKTGPEIVAETRFRHVFGQQQDPNREVVLNIVAFDIPQPEKTDTAPRITKL
jgi:hypothetical protein